MLTATPVNTGIGTLVNLLRVLTKGNRSVWAPDIADYERYLKRVERGDADPFPVLDRSIVRRSRSDILRAQDEARAAGLVIESLELPERRPVHVDHRYGGAEEPVRRLRTHPARTRAGSVRPGAFPSANGRKREEARAPRRRRKPNRRGGH